jgi:hypothetical protein
MLRRRDKNNAWKIDDKFVCTATHPKTSNWSGNSRDRKIHLSPGEPFGSGKWRHGVEIIGTVAPSIYAMTNAMSVPY